jgi:hypothetical protein
VAVAVAVATVTLSFASLRDKKELLFFFLLIQHCRPILLLDPVLDGRKSNLNAELDRVFFLKSAKRRRRRRRRRKTIEFIHVGSARPPLSLLSKGFGWWG